MFLEYDDLPIHQVPISLAHSMGGHPNAYDRFFFNAYREDVFVAVAMGLYPNRGVIDAAIGVVAGGLQRSIFASGALRGRETSVGPISIEVTAPMREATIHLDAADLGFEGELRFTARTVATEEPRQTRHDGARLFMDATRVTQLGTWAGSLDLGDDRVDLSTSRTYGTKDRSWGVRPVGEPVVAAPSSQSPQLFFVWTPINFDDLGMHLSTFEDAAGVPWSSTAVTLELLDAARSPVDPSGVHHLQAGQPRVRFASGLRRPVHASIAVTADDATTSSIELEPLLTFRMRGAGYLHPTFAHGRYHGELVVHTERHDVDELDTTSIHDVHVEQVVRATWGDRVGLGTLEVLPIGAHAPSALTGFLDGAP
jgi:hypothetical protein